MANRLTRLLAELQETSEAHRELIARPRGKYFPPAVAPQANLLLRRIRNLHVNINQERLKGQITLTKPWSTRKPPTLKRNPPMAEDSSLAIRRPTPRRKPTTDDISVRIDDQRVDLDPLAVTEIRLALSEYHGRLARRVGDSTDMDESSQVAATLITVRLIHTNLER